MLQDADKQTEENPASKTLTGAFACPPDFEPEFFLIVALDKEGRHFTNTPAQPPLALRLATIGIDFAAKQSITSMLQRDGAKSNIVVAPAGSVPTFPGPAGRG